MSKHSIRGYAALTIQNRYRTRLKLLRSENDTYKNTQLKQITGSCAIFSALNILLMSSISRMILKTKLAEFMKKHNLKTFQSLNQNNKCPTITAYNLYAVIYSYFYKKPNQRPRTARFAPNINIKNYQPKLGYNPYYILKSIMNKLDLNDEFKIYKFPYRPSGYTLISSIIYLISPKNRHGISGIKVGNTYKIVDSNGGIYDYDWTKGYGSEILDFLKSKDKCYNLFTRSYIRLKIYVKNGLYKNVNLPKSIRQTILNHFERMGAITHHPYNYITMVNSNQKYSIQVKFEFDESTYNIVIHYYSSEVFQEVDKKIKEIQEYLKGLGFKVKHIVRGFKKDSIPDIDVIRNYFKNKTIHNVGVQRAILNYSSKSP